MHNIYTPDTESINFTRQKYLKLTYQTYTNKRKITVFAAAILIFYQSSLSIKISLSIYQSISLYCHMSSKVYMHTEWGTVLKAIMRAVKLKELPLALYCYKQCFTWKTQSVAAKFDPQAKGQLERERPVDCQQNKTLVDVECGWNLQQQ